MSCHSAVSGDQNCVTSGRHAASLSLFVLLCTIVLLTLTPTHEAPTPVDGGRASGIPKVMGWVHLRPSPGEPKP